ncbi:hypothetical protein CERSUDRAFT_45774 [Gelatoporia subvermispora B]|uniref:Sensitive to high expression protein 9, mitochondrial n=1 Tax=Ceriporiopsis subvermispora (strain B) TaxID=914234 RepID=M2PTH7_CERS8|nr:hypothetical protein CERSUDRAFT_45774 [Gelatoporia subvermispora B]
MFRPALRLPKRSLLGPEIARRSSLRVHPPAFHLQLRLSSSHSHPPTPPKEPESQQRNADAQPEQSPSVEQPTREPVREPQDNNHLQLDAVKERLRSWSENAGIQLRQRADDWTARVATTFSHLGSELNKVTGYGEIEALKRQARINAARQAAREAKEAYDKAVIQRATSQREVNDLLQRKSHWTDEDVSRFTALVRQDHVYEQAETRAKEVASQSEDAVEREFSELMRVILNRYHEEQAWSDKIRSASTYGSLAAMGLNVLVFVLAIILVEPWKRRRLAQTFERKVKQMSAESISALEGKTAELVRRLDRQDKVLANIFEGQYFANHLPTEDLARMNAETAAQAALERKRTPSILASERDLALAMAGGATVAAVLGWLARSLYG